MYSQRDEENYIVPFFQGQKGTFLDIGAYHPFKFSNTRRLYELGWKGAFIEPSKSVTEAFRTEYAEEFASGRLELHEIAIDTRDGERTFYDSKGDAVSSFNEASVRKWGTDPITTTAPTYTIPSFLKLTKFDKFDFINIDVEGVGMEVLVQIPFDQLGVKMVCIEYDDKLLQIQILLTQKGFHMLHRTPENLIFAR